MGVKNQPRRTGPTPGPVTNPPKEGVGNDVAPAGGKGKGKKGPVTTPNKKGVGKDLTQKGRVKQGRSA